ncbi:MAG: polysaccharide export protein, partial [Desulfovibrio sp.]|nr:polysaccharide export protein [Desulfovibrio sp.]
MMTRLYSCIALICLLLAAAPVGAVSTSTASRQALMGGLADGVNGQSGQPTARPAIDADTVMPQARQGAGMQPGQLQEQQSPYSPVQRAFLPRVEPAPISAPPAWAQSPYPANAMEGLQPFGASLFLGNFAGTWHD